MTKENESVKQSSTTYFFDYCLLRILEIAIKNSFPDGEWDTVNLWYINLYQQTSKEALLMGNIQLYPIRFVKHISRTMMYVLVNSRK